MRKIFGILIKILPLLTLYKGITSGGARLGPFVDTIKVALTQYEVGQITKLTYADFAQSSKTPDPQKFSHFIRENFHDQYSVLAREIKGDKSHDHTLDIWGNPFQLYVNQNIGQVKVSSSGPDGIASNKDDIAMDFSFEVQERRRPAEVAKKVQVEEPLEVVQAAENLEVESDVHEEGFSEEGYVQDGLDQETEEQDGNFYNETEEYSE